MGCGGSKTESGKDAVGQKLPPVLRRRYEEIRGRRHAAGLGTLSKKELLKEGINEEHERSPSQFRTIGDDNDINHRQSTCSPEEIAAILRAAKVTPEPAEEAAEPDSSGGAVTDNKKEEKPLVEETEQGESEGEGEEEEDDDSSGGSNVRDDCLRHSSPSFRVYCVDSSDNGKDEDDSKEDDDKSQSQSQNSRDDIDSGEIFANGASRIKTKEKGKKGRRFRMNMCKGRNPAAIKSLMNVTSCYPPSSSRHDKARLLVPKPEPNS
ncbi:hypothetical protein Pint_01241 [Pistacia integerrima]|uniref:Uncharacterized protein n=1 Tax=Pistacia integerrima TaxID=434235 RepID=A0ACC0ZIC3_9ROSI|nr:hypothetical protein Pint_01241 [Pistacia integerrima]